MIRFVIGKEEACEVCSDSKFYSTTAFCFESLCDVNQAHKFYPVYGVVGIPASSCRLGGVTVSILVADYIGSFLNPQSYITVSTYGLSEFVCHIDALELISL